MPNHTLAQPPEGFYYYPDFLSVGDECALIEQIMALEFSEVRMHGVTAKRRVAHFGWIYGYESWRLARGPDIPDFLLPLRERAAHLLDREPKNLSEVLVTEYPPGAGIGWHRGRADVRTGGNRHLGCLGMPFPFPTRLCRPIREQNVDVGASFSLPPPRDSESPVAAFDPTCESVALFHYIENVLDESRWASLEEPE